MKGRTLLLSGPTASGKSAVALHLARELGGEIITADSMQVFRGMDVGTAKPTAAEQALAPHHLLDCVEPGEAFDAARWLTEATACAAEIHRRGRLAIVCGGTGLYFKLWREGLHAPPPVDPRLREQLEATPLATLVEELRQRAPEIAGRLDLANPRRVVRALEILRSASAGGGASPPVLAPVDPSAVVVVLQRAPDDLKVRVRARVDAMFAAGLIEETRALIARGLRGNRVACQAIGYRQVLEHFEGVRDLPATLEEVKARTWQFARRQMTWFRHQVPSAWVPVAANAGVPEIAEAVMEAARTGGATG